MKMKKFYPKKIKQDFINWFTKTIYYPIYRFWSNNIYDFFRYDLWRGLANLRNFFPEVWNNRDWDCDYTTFCLLKKKLELAEPVIRNGSHVGCEKSAKQIRICITLLDRLIRDDYHDMVFKDHYKKWGEPRLGWEPESDNMCRMTTYQINVRNPQDKKQEEAEARILYNRVEELKQQDLNMLFEIMRKNIRSWWD